MKPFAVFVFAGCSLFALPSGMQVVSGSAEAAGGGGLLSVSCSDRAILEWNGFSIGQGETAQFLLPSSGAVVLNRVIGGSASELLGLMQSNGQIYLLNPQGVLIGPDARIESAGFLASTLDALNEDFLAKGELLFAGNSDGAILNLGTISCPKGDVALFARFVRNEGAIEAGEGHAALVSAPEILLKLDGKTYIRPDLGTESKEMGEFAVENRGSVEALSVELRSGASPYAQAIRNGGSIRAVGRVEENGVVYLVAEQGYTEVAGKVEARGGEVRVLGDRVALKEGSEIDVSHEAGGGTVLVGGSFQGKDPSVKAAKVALVEKGASIRADARGEGDGGKVVVWSERTTGFYGEIGADGGVFGGDGGEIEVSGPSLSFQGLCSAKAPLGKFGTVLLDPNDIAITGAASAPATVSNVYYDGAGTAMANLLFTDLQTMLASANVVVQTDDTTVGGTGLIDVTAAITWAAATQLTLRATSQIVVNPGSSITNTSAGTGTGVPFTAVYLIANQTNRLINGPGIQINQASITTDAGDIYLNGVGGGTAGNNYGIEFFASGVSSAISSTSGSITLIGKMGPEDGTQSTNNHGVYIHANPAVTATVSTQSGNITILGTSYHIRSMTMMTDNQGVLIGPNGFVSTATSDAASLILIEGTGGNGDTSGSCGVQISDNSGVIAEQGSISIIGRANGDLTGNHGIFLYNDSLIQSTGAGVNGSMIVLEGIGSPSAAATTNNCGVCVSASSGAFGIRTVDKDISITGTGAAAATLNLNAGISIRNDTLINNPGQILSSGLGNIALTGFGKSGLGGAGVLILNNGGVGTSLIQSSQGTISLYGESSAANSSPGIYMETLGRIESASGNINLTGYAYGTGSANSGIQISDSYIYTSSTGNINITGRGSPNAGSGNSGVIFQYTGTITPFTLQTVDGEISINGFGEGNGNGNSGIRIFTTGNTMQMGVSGVGAGSLTMYGVGGNGSNMNPSNHGILLQGNGAPNPVVLTTDSGAIGLTGIGGTDNGAFGNCEGIHTENMCMITSATGDIILYGEGVSSNAANAGIHLDNTDVNSTGNATGIVSFTGIGSRNGTNDNIGIYIESLFRGVGIHSARKNIYMNGIGGGSGTGNYGILLADIAFVQASGLMPLAEIHLQGYGGAGTNDNIGIYLQGGAMGPPNVMTAFGNLSLLGIGNGTGTGSHGIRITDGASVQTTGNTTAATLQLDGRGSSSGMGNCIGLYCSNAAMASTNIRTSGQDIFIKAMSGRATSEALLLDTAGIQAADTSDAIYVQTLASDFATGGDLVLTHTGALIQTNYLSGSEAIDLDVARDLSLSDGAGINTARLTIETGRDLLIDGNGATSTGGTGLLVGDFVTFPVGNISLDIGRHMSLTGGAMADQAAHIVATSGQITFFTEGDVLLQGGGTATSLAQIGGIVGNGSIFSPIIGGSVILTGGVGSASIGYGNATMSFPGTPNNTGSITLLTIGGDVILRGGLSAGGLAQIGHISSAAGPALDIGGNIYIRALGDVIFNDMGTVAGTSAQIGHGGPGASATYNTAGAVEVIAGGSINMAGAAGSARIVNPIAVGSATYPASGSITLVADNSSPQNPFVGANVLSMNATSTIANNSASGGQVRLYTTQQNFAAIAPGLTINGAIYMPSAMPGVNTAYENFNLYYGAGQYIGPEFALYYKLPFAINPICPTCPVCPAGGGGSCPVELFIFYPELYALAVAEAEFNDLFPNIPAAPHQGRVCIGILDSSCVPGFSRFETFLFENSVDRMLRLEKD